MIRLRFLRAEGGYAMVLILMLMPVFIWLCLLVIDIGRGNSAQTDMAAAADALALAGAGELDGQSDAMERARTAMASLSNTVNFLGIDAEGAHITLRYAADGGDFLVYFLTDIPASDDAPIDAAFLATHATAVSHLARYVYVTVLPKTLTTFFPIPRDNARQDLTVIARAVAGSRTEACDVAPLFICNPLEASGETLETVFAAGGLHARLLRMVPVTTGESMPGNFGFMTSLTTPDMSNQSTKAMAELFAGKPNPTCYDQQRVTTLTGGHDISDGLNTRFDLYANRFNIDFQLYPPAFNVRKGYIPKDANNPNYCIMVPANPTLNYALPLLDNATMTRPASGVRGSFLGAGSWDITRYWQVNFGGALTGAQKAAMSSFAVTDPATGEIMPSRYDVYRYEIAQGLVSTLSRGGPAGLGRNRESGAPLCAMAQDPLPAISDTPDKRVTFAAIIDCLANPGGPGNTLRPVRDFASVFLVNPLDIKDMGTAKMDVEIIDLTGAASGRIRREPVLVR
jgi:Flp pilus assembly protein TadG